MYKIYFQEHDGIMSKRYTASSKDPEIMREPTKIPSLTVAIPTFNEEQNIERIIYGFLGTTYPNLIEIYIADGGSTDSTQAIVQRLGLEDPRIKLIHNPLKTQSAGLNLILEECTGEVFLRADAHSDYAPDYIERCVEALVKSQALNAGGAQRFVAKTPFQAGIALATKSLLGSGGAKYRDPEYSGYADTVYLGCFWRESLLKVASNNQPAVMTGNASHNLNVKMVFDPTQITNQDAELNQRLLSQKKSAIYISSKIRAWYYPRKSWTALWMQYFKYGRGRCLTTAKHNSLSQIRGQLPFITISLVLLMSFAGLISPSLRPIILMLLGVGILAPVGESLRVTLKYDLNFNQEIWRGNRQQKPSIIQRSLLCYIILMTIPIAHFSGYAYQLIRRHLLNVQNW
jgi:succinoglycan biosynthesis protein ExoA